MNIEEVKKQKMQSARAFILDGFTVIKTDPKLSESLDIHQRAFPNFETLPRKSNHQVLDVFFCGQPSQYFRSHSKENN